MKKFLHTALTLVAALAAASCCEKTECAQTPSAPATDNQTVRLNVFYTLNEGADADHVKNIADSLVAASRNDEGCISYDFFESTTTPGQYMIIETWANDSLLQIHSNAPHFVKFVPQLEQSGTMTMQRFTVEE